MDEKKTEVKPIVRQRLCVYRKLDENDDAFIEKEVRAFRPLYVIARSLGCDRRTLSSYIKKRFPDLLSEMRESMLDIAEAKLLQNINSGNENSIEYFLDRQGKDRCGSGGTRQELSSQACRRTVRQAGRPEPEDKSGRQPRIRQGNEENVHRS